MKNKTLNVSFIVTILIAISVYVLFFYKSLTDQLVIATFGVLLVNVVYAYFVIRQSEKLTMVMQGYFTILMLFVQVVAGVVLVGLVKCDLVQYLSFAVIVLLVTFLVNFFIGRFYGQREDINSNDSPQMNSVRLIMDELKFKFRDDELFEKFNAIYDDVKFLDAFSFDPAMLDLAVSMKEDAKLSEDKLNEFSLLIVKSKGQADMLRRGRD